ncbi:MAG: hypothetical protein KKB50_00480 [Planctomycetes bacterium]|nr:hypothetical protein [Planctomycetota bacterium]
MRESERVDGDLAKRRALAGHATGRHALEVLRAKRVMVELLLTRGQATIDDVRAALELPAGGVYHWFGAVSTGLRAAGLIRRAGYLETTRPEAHGRPIGLWELTHADAARAWLAANPAPIAPQPPVPGLLFPELWHD